MKMKININNKLGFATQKITKLFNELKKMRSGCIY